MQIQIHMPKCCGFNGSGVTWYMARAWKKVRATAFFNTVPRPFFHARAKYPVTPDPRHLNVPVTASTLQPTVLNRRPPTSSPPIVPWIVEIFLKGLYSVHCTVFSVQCTLNTVHCTHSFIWPIMQRLQWPIHKSTLETFILSIMWKISSFLGFKVFNSYVFLQ